MVSRLETSTPEKARSIDILHLFQETHDILSMVQEPNTKEREVLEAKGFVFLPTFAKSLSEVVFENPDHFFNQRDFVNNVSGLRDYVPQEITVAINPRKPFIPRSFGKSQAEQFMMIEEQSQALQIELPNARIVMLPASTHAQADIAYFKKTGKKLFRKFVRCLDQNSGFFAASVGRLSRKDRLRVGDCYYTAQINSLGAVFAIVFLQDKEAESDIIKE